MDGIEEEQIDGIMLAILVGNGVGIGDGIWLGKVDSIGEEVEVGTIVVLGSLLGLETGFREGTAAVGSLVGARVGRDEGIGHVGLERGDDGLQVGMVEGGLFWLNDGMFVLLGNKVGCVLGIEVFGIAVKQGFGL